MSNKIAITLTSFAQYEYSPLRLLEEKGFEVITNPFGRKLDRKEAIEICKGCIGIVAGTEDYDSDILVHLKDLRVISRCGAGLENIDIETANKMGIRIFNTPDAPTQAVSELTVGLILGLLRKIYQADREIRNGRWEKIMGSLLYGKKIGIIGLGRIGQKVGEILSHFGTEVSYCDLENKSTSFKCTRKNLDEILRWADIITLHVAMTKKESPLIKSRELNMMKRDSYLINVSRGKVVDEDALYRTLKDGRLSGAALDVFEKEPYTGPFRELDNLILTPHIGSYAKEARVKMEIEAVNNLLRGLGALD